MGDYFNDLPTTKPDLTRTHVRMGRSAKVRTILHDNILEEVK